MDDPFYFHKISYLNRKQDRPTVVLSDVVMARWCYNPSNVNAAANSKVTSFGDHTLAAL